MKTPVGESWRGFFCICHACNMKTLLALRKRLPLCQHRSNDQFAQHFLVHIRKRLDVKTALAGGVFSQLGEQQLGLVAVHDTVQNRRRFSRRETHQNRVTLAPALLLIMVGTEANDRRPPHSGCFARGAFHQSNERFRVGPLGRLRQCVDERRYTHRGRLGFIGRHRLPPPILKMWLHSTPVREFERGRMDAAEFAAAVTAEFRLPVQPQEFLDSFTGWVTGLYPGTLEMLAQIPSSYPRALLSNSNALHWTRVVSDLQLGPAFDHHFVSHLTGRIKPDADAFEHVVDSLDCRPEQVLFLDDNTLNVDAAKRFGMQAVRVRGIDETKRALVERGVIDSAG